MERRNSVICLCMPASWRDTARLTDLSIPEDSSGCAQVGFWWDVPGGAAKSSGGGGGRATPTSMGSSIRASEHIHDARLSASIAAANAALPCLDLPPPYHNERALHVIR